MDTIKRHTTRRVAAEVRKICAVVFEGNRREGVRDGIPYAYTAPSPTRYPWQWYWDSCFIAIALRHIDPKRARQELESLLNASTPEGFIGHTIFWGKKLTLRRLPIYNVVHRRDSMTSTIQPPLLAWAWRIVVGDPALEPAIVRHQAEITRLRDLEGDGLIWIIQPDESGLDASPIFDPVWGKENGGRLGFRRLLVRNRKFNFDARKIAAAGLPVACDPLTNTLHGLSRLALGQPSITPALVKRLWDKEAGLFVLEAKPGIDKRLPVTCAALAPLALPDLPEEIAREMIERHVLNNKSFWTEVASPSVALDDPAFSLKDSIGPLKRYWRGPTWVNTTWLVWLGLTRLGYTAEANRLADSIAQAVRREGLREYYNPLTGKGMGTKDFGWSTLVLDMLANDPRARTSYIPARSLGTPQSRPPRPNTAPARPAASSMGR